MVKLICSGLGLGYVKGGGTLAAVATGLALYAARHCRPSERPVLAAALTVTLLGAGTLAAQRVETDWGKDSYRVVIDEVAGMWVSMLGVPATLRHLAAALVLFRFFDIKKPLGIRRLEQLPGGVGVMADDVAAGICANLLLRAGCKLLTQPAR